MRYIRWRLLTAVVLGSTIGAGFGSGLGAAPVRPSFVIILADDMSAAQMTAMRRVQTTIGNAGLTFDRAYVETPVCAPTRATLLTGRLAHNHGVLSTAGTRPRMMAVDHDTIASRLAAAGYRTAFLGKYNNGYDCSYVPAGWHLWRGFCGLAPTNAITVIDGVRARVPGHSDDWIRDQASRFIRETPRDRPFLLVASSVQPHTPHDPARRHRGMFAGAMVPRTPAFNEADVSDLPPFLQKPLLSPVQIQELDRAWALTLEELQTIDEMVEGIVAALQQTGRINNTYVIFTSDNGAHYGEHRFREGKWTTFETDIRVPFVVRGPGVPARTRQQAMIGIVDVPATLLELARASVAGLDGVSFASALRGGPGRREAMPIAFWTERYQLHWKGVRTARHTYAEYSASTRLLYDNVVDPHQINNLSRDPSSTALRDTLRAQTQRLFACRGSEACRR
jgi:arylsulfatase A-like enzyme